jgi:hypothetical protein
MAVTTHISRWMGSAYLHRARIHVAATVTRRPVGSAIKILKTTPIKPTAAVTHRRPAEDASFEDSHGNNIG